MRRDGQTKTAQVTIGQCALHPPRLRYLEQFSERNIILNSKAERVALAQAAIQDIRPVSIVEPDNLFA